MSAARDDESRNKDYKEQGIGAPDRNFSQTRRSVDEIKELGSLNAGITYQDDHEITLNSYLIRNTESEAMIQTGNNSSFEAGSGEEFVNYDTRYEERELLVLQALGEHTFDQLSGNILGDIRVDWFSSDSEATTDIPHQVRVQGSRELNIATGEEISRSVLSTTSAATYAFLELEDNVRSRGINAHLPIMLGKAEITFSGGYNYSDKSREYYGYTANINAGGVTSDVLSGTPGGVFSNGNIGNPANSFSFSMGSGLGTESYIAGQITDAGYGMMDLTWDYRWRLTAGARYENFRQALMPLDLLEYSYVEERIEELQNESQSLALKEDDWYPSIALTYMNEGFMGTENFQVRFSASQTVVRPDLREKSEVSFINEDRIRVFGNPSLISSEIDHFDLRTEWFYSGGDNFTVSLFYKDLLDPIEQSRRPGSDNNIELTFYNAVSGEIYGVELEGLKDIGAGFFLSSNLTLSKSEIISQKGQGFTNTKRSMTGHSEYVLNAQLGYDSDDGLHSVSAVFNVFGERVYYAARADRHDDAFEQPFASLDLVYNFYPTSNITTKLKATNLLNDKRTYEQTNVNGENVTILEREVGTGVSVEFAYSF
jgi:outer membrane receptor protein involved in Fe transport